MKIQDQQGMTQQADSVTFDSDIIVDTDISSMDRQIGRSSYNEQKYGKVVPLNIEILGHRLYANPQIQMLAFTILLTLGLEFVMLKFVFFGMHFYVGVLLCMYIVYLLLCLGFSNPGFAFEEYESMQQHFDLQSCTPACRHASNLSQQFGYRCNKCQINMKKLSKHCTICESCFSDYDHHCVFIGKCVAANNMGKFKLFLCLIFGTLIYGLVSSLMNLQQIHQLAAK